MVRRVIVATDGSEPAKRAEAVAAKLASPGQPIEFVVVYVHPQLPPRNVKVSPDAPWYRNRDKLPASVVAQGEAVLRGAESRVRQAAGTAAISVWRRLLGSSDVAGVIVHEAERSGADLIVMGGRTQRGLLALLDNSVADEVMRRAHRPVLLVP
jgi:nucleotide-binding universal stress UspA family protein